MLHNKIKIHSRQSKSDQMIKAYRKESLAYLFVKNRLMFKKIELKQNNENDILHF